MKKIWIAFTVILSQPLYAEESGEDLSIVSFGGITQDAQREVFFEPFSKESGKKIKEINYNGGISQIAEMAKKDKSEWDLVQVEASDLVEGCRNNYFETLNWNLIGQKSEYVRGATHNCGVGSFIWAMVMAYNQDIFQENPPQSWADFWDVQKYPGKRGLRKTARFTYEIALLAAGVQGRDVYTILRAPNGFEQALKKLEELLPHIEWWEEGAQPSQWLQTKNVVMSAGYNGRIANAIKDGNNFRMIWKNAIYSIDYWVILKNSHHKDAAYQLLRYMAPLRRQADFAELIPYGPPTKRSYKMLRRDTQMMLPDVQNKTGTVFPFDYEFWGVVGEKYEAEFQDWLVRKIKELETKRFGPEVIVNVPQSSTFYLNEKK
ncbi:MAG: ABC transporter substrate-binding protein [Alphaproteobacteria bacterium]|nr:ABC transporter substrate-binding protein [Alphaproteobacteria bacterium]